MQKIRWRGSTTCSASRTTRCFFFIKEYEPPYRPVDAPQLNRQAREGSFRRPAVAPTRRPSLITTSGKVARATLRFNADAIPKNSKKL
jgi:hypothetical protein